ncbi:MAG: putative DNA binding domain-containing protein, partial [Planctomycetes bacterium]|nr:putative DNA binding domain-containing protein [Planctomycetota bacterium]
MSGVLPLGVEQLVGGSAVESVRLELKAGWNAQTVGPQILETLCAFANDLQNLNGGYVVIGVAEREGVAVRPVQGLDPKELDAAQKWIRGNCNRITPAYMPVLSPERLDGKLVLVLWAPASDLRPHQAPGARVQGHRYFVRIGSETVEAKGEILTRLLQSTARVPFDDRRAFEATVADLRETRVREFLQDVKSELVNDADVPRVYRLMQITRSANGHEAPRNVALLFFSDTPERWFPGARIEVAEFADDAGGNTIEERSFRGPLHDQVRQCLAFLEQMSTRHLEKAHDRIETHGWVSYPSLALREAVVNAVYHRSYEDIAEPSKIYLYPNRIEVISYPGPVDGIDRKHLGGHQPLPPVPARNRRIGEFLKELRLAE